MGLAACSALGLTACNEGATQGSVAIDGGGAPDYSYTQDGPLVAKLTVEAPEIESFILRATLPVPPGTYTDGDVLVPLSVLSSSDTTAAPSQVEIVSRYADDQQGASVVEVLAHVRRPNVPPGTPIDYEVVYHPHAPDAFHLKEEVQALLDAPGALVLRAKDVYGHDYAFDVLADRRAGQGQPIRSGSIVQETKTSGALLPVTPTTGAQATMPHLMGVHAFVRTFDREDFFALDLHFHNGFDGRDPSTSADDLLNELHFERLGLRLPAGWRVVHAVPNPFTGSPAVSGGMQQVDLVAPYPNGRLHFMPRQSQFWRRIMIARDAAAEARARVVLERRNMGFCQPGTSNTGAELWSWWNPETARYLPQAHRLPELDEMSNRENLRAGFAVQLDNRLMQVRQGAAGSYPVISPGMGWAHPWGVDHGAMTGGDEITQTIGTEVAWSGSQAGYRLMELKARMNLDRQPVALYDADGSPLTIEEYTVPNGTYGPYQPQPFTMRPMGNDTFGFANAPMFQAVSAISTGRVAPYRDQLASYQSHDLQHYVRYVSPLMALVWLGNDSLAKQLLSDSAELFLLSHNENYIENWGYVSGESLRARREHVAAYPGTGVAYGRGEAWGLYTASAAYAIGDADQRRRFQPWLRSIAEVIRDGQSTCTGNITSYRVDNYMNGQYLTRQSFELSFLVNSLESMRRTVFESVDPTLHATLGDVIAGAAYSTVQAPFWDSSRHGQRRAVGVGLSDFSQPDFCASIPTAALYNEYLDTGSQWTTWAYAYELTHDAIFLQRTMESIQGSGNVLNELENEGLSCLPDSAPLLAVMQSMSSL